MLFDRNADTNGTSVTHSNNSADVILQQPGFYSVSFHGTVAPSSSAKFPLSIQLYLTKNSSVVTGTGQSHNFQSSAETANYSFSQIINVNSAPTTLNVVSQGGSIIYSNISITVNRLGDN